MDKLGFVWGVSCTVRRRSAVVALSSDGTSSDYDKGNGCSRREFILAGLSIGYMRGGGKAMVEQATGKALLRSASWELADCPTDSTIADVAMLPSSKERVFAVCRSGELLESFDGGLSWNLRDQMRSPLRSIQFKAGDGWIAGEDGLLLYTADAGRTWSEVEPPKPFPGDVLLAAPTGRGSVEILSTLGPTFTRAMEQSQWKQVASEIPQTIGNDLIGHLRVASRDRAGNYIGIPARGSSVVSLRAGDKTWRAQKRAQSTRPLNGGFVNDSVKDGVWLSDRSGDLFITKSKVDLSKSLLPLELDTSLSTRGFGVLDVDFSAPSQIFAIVGSGNFYSSTDGGQTWSQDRTVQVPGQNLRSLRYPFAFGKNGLILRHSPGASASKTN